MDEEISAKGSPAQRPIKKAPAAQDEGAAQSRGKGMAPGSQHARVRVYRGFLGDCILLRLPREGKEDFTILIDCGAVLGTEDATACMNRVMEDVLATTKGHVDVLVATHEHWDHVSGFLQAGDAFAKLDVGEVWVAWTEDPNDEEAQALGDKRDEALTTLRLALGHLRAAADDDTARKVEGLTEFFGAAAGGKTTRDAMNAVKAKNPKHLRYCAPGDPPLPLEGTGARVFVLGPPRDTKALNKVAPSRATPETYGMRVAFLEDTVQDALAADDASSPFTTLQAIPAPIAQQMDFFRASYFGNDADAWRRIDSAWLGGAPELALALDSATNNTSLVLAVELAPGGDVLLFAADAQVGSWLSWRDVAWPEEKVTGPDLLQRTTFYKVGHHGSHNATLKEQGLELMKSLRFAVIPVDHDMAVRKRWGRIPLPALVEALGQKAAGVLRTDEDGSKLDGVEATDLYFECTL